MSKQVELTVRAKAFSGEGVRTHRAMVEDSAVTVWDTVAGHYTNCHALSEAQIARLVLVAQRVSGGSRPAFRTVYL